MTASRSRHARSVGLASFAMVLLAVACSTPQQRVVPQEVASASPQQEALTPENDVSAQGSVRATVAAARLFAERHPDLTTLNDAALTAKTPALLYVPASRLFSEVSYEVRGEDALAVAAMSPSGACFGALDSGDGSRPTYSHSGVGQAECSATDVPYPIPGF